MRRLFALLVLVALAAAAFWLSRGLGWDTLARNQEALHGWVAAHPLLAAAAYVAFYFVTSALSLPHGAVLTVAGGLLFGPVAATILTAIGATAGAAALVAMLRTLLADTLRRQQRRIPAAMQARLARDGLGYLLFVRLLPVFPFWVVTLAAAVAGLRLPVFIAGTAIGILPATFVFASIGSGVGAILSEGRTPDLAAIFAPHILLPLLALAVLSLLPAALRGRIRRA